MCQFRSVHEVGRSLTSFLFEPHCSTASPGVTASIVTYDTSYVYPISGLVESSVAIDYCASVTEIPNEANQVYRNIVLLNTANTILLLICVASVETHGVAVAHQNLTRRREWALILRYWSGEQYTINLQ